MINNPESIDTVLFDLDETLIQNRELEELCGDIFDKFADRLSHVDRRKFWPTFWTRAWDMWCMMIDGAIEAETAHRYTFINTLRALEADEALAEEMIEYGARCQAEATQLFEDTAPVLKQLREAGKRLGIITNGYPIPQRLKIAQHALEPMVDVVVVSGEARSHKPDPAVFKVALDELRAEPAQAIYIGDMPDADIEGARRAGMQALLIDPHDKWAHLEAVPRLKRLRDLLPLLGLNGHAKK